MKRRLRTTKSLTVKKRIVGFFAIAVILLGMVAGFSINNVIAGSDSTTGGGADKSAPVAVVAKTSESTTSGGSGGATNANVLVGDNTGSSTGSQTQAKQKDTDYIPSVSVNNMSTYPQTGDAHDSGLVILGFTILIGLFAFYGLKLRKDFKSLRFSRVTK